MIIDNDGLYYYEDIVNIKNNNVWDNILRKKKYIVFEGSNMNNDYSFNITKTTLSGKNISVKLYKINNTTLYRVTTNDPDSTKVFQKLYKIYLKNK